MSEEQFERLMDPYDYLVAGNAGKGFRNELLRCFNVYFELTADTLAGVQEVISMLHNSSLLIDDIEDNSQFRRGKECAHRVYGVASTLNVANMTYFKALRRLTDLTDDNEKIAKLTDQFTASMSKLHQGQGIGIYWKENSECPSEESYMKMVDYKTGELFQLGREIMGILSEQKDGRIMTVLEEFCEQLGRYYQIQNDIDGLSYDNESGSFAPDLDEGNLTHPIIHCINSGSISISEVRRCHTETEKRDLYDRITLNDGLTHSESRLRSTRERICSLLGAPAPVFAALGRLPGGWCKI